MNWNHRLIDLSTPQEAYIAMHEVYYTDGKPVGYCATPAAPGGENPADVLITLDRMRKACELPILKPSDFPGFRAAPAVPLRTTPVVRMSDEDTIANILAWVDSRIEVEVTHRPETNIFTRTLRDTWGQIRNHLIGLMSNPAPALPIQPIPAGYYWSVRSKDFFNSEGKMCDREFLQLWSGRASEFPQSRHALAAIESIAEDARRKGIAVQEAARRARVIEAFNRIPPLVFWSAYTSNFHDATTLIGMGNDFYMKWCDRMLDFPRSVEEARALAARKSDT